MVENKNRELLEEAIETGIKELLNMQPGTDDYDKHVQSLNRLYELRMSEKKLETEAQTQHLSTELEIQKMAHEAELAREETKQSYVKAGCEMFTKVMGCVCTGVWLHSIMHFEETGTISTKAFGFMPKLKIF